MKQDIISNRKRYLEILRSGKYTKGTIKSDNKGYPVDPDYQGGHCVCSIILHEFGEEINGKFRMSKSLKSLGLKPSDCKYIQEEINDTSQDFNTMADRIEKEVFKSTI